MKRAIANCSFYDKVEDVLRNSGDVFTCDDERGKELAGLGLVWTNDVPEEKPKRKPATKKKTKK